MAGQDVGDGLLGQPIAAALEVERRRAPDGAPSAGERLRAAAVPRVKKRDDGAKHVVGEVADEIGLARRHVLEIAGICERGGRGFGP